MTWDQNAYDTPEKLGLKIVASESEPNLSYEYNMFIIWEDEAGQFYYASDVGCSCPSPFENYTELSDLTASTATEAFDALRAWKSNFLKEVN